MELTGNPFVDVGLGIAAARKGIPSVELLSADDLRDGVGILHRAVAKLKDFNILAAFWNNNPFMGKNNSPGTRAKFDSFLNRLAAGSLPSKAGYCQICGRSPVLSEEADRCWFPLAGGRDSDPCTLPWLQGKTVCANCLSAVVILPLGCRFCPDGPYFVHVTGPELQVQAGSEAVATLNAALSVNASGGIRHQTALRGRVALLDIASRSVLWDHTQEGHMEDIPTFGATMISFSNRGDRPCLYQLHFPAQALEFFGEIGVAGVKPTFVDWVKEIDQRFKKQTEKTAYFDQLCDCVEERRSLASLLVMLRAVKDGEGQLKSEEYKVLRIYEDVALQKRERFDALERVANKVRDMPSRYKDSFIKRLGNLGSKRSLLELVKEFCKNESTGLRITPSELRVIDYGPSNEVASLLYLLCKAEGDDEQ